MTRLTSSCVAVAVLVGPAAAMMGQESPQDYPQWRGRNRDGTASAFSKPESWPDHLRLRWKVDVGEGYATPIVAGRTVYAFTRRDGRFRYASPIIVDLHGTRQVIAVAQQSILGIALADGAVLWERPWKSPDVRAITPVLYRETIIVSGHQRGVIALRPVRRDDAWGVEVAWETQDVSMYVSNPVVIGDTLFGLSPRNSGQYFAIDASTGRVLWLDRPRRATNTALVTADDLLFLLNDDAELIVARSSRTGFEPLRRYSVADSATWAQPAISGKRIFIKDVSSLALWSLD